MKMVVSGKNPFCLFKEPFSITTVFLGYKTAGAEKLYTRAGRYTHTDEFFPSLLVLKH